MERSGDWEVDLSRRELRVDGASVPIGARAFEIIEALVRAEGELVTKDELMRRVWPGAIVEENTLHAHISAIRKALGADRALLKAATGRGYRLAGTWRQTQGRQESAVAQLISAAGRAARPGNIPVSAPDLFGRSAALGQLRELILARRVVTLTGVGGIGKTSLAVATARSLAPEFPDGAWLVELASVSDPNLTPTSIASALRLMLDGADPSALVIAKAIGEKKLLLVLDNCEHVIDAAARCVETLFRNCGNAHVVATSREVLQIDGEHAFRVAPLDTPPEDVDEFDELLDNDAVQLFVTRMDTLHAKPSLGREHLSIIAAICRRLDGILLGIEFAAARAAELGPQQVAARLDDRFGILTGGRRTSLPRHQTLRATLDWSYELLSTDEKRLFRRLGVFPSGFTLGAAVALADAKASDGVSEVDGVAYLVAKSLAFLDGQVAGGRWRMLETVRSYAFERLVENGEVESAQRRRAEFLIEFFAPVAPGSQSPFTRDDIARYETELDNVRAALDWACSPAGDIRLAVSLAVGCIPMWIYLSLMPECRERTEATLVRLGPESEVSAPHRMQLLIALGTALTFSLGPTDRARAALSTALVLAKELDEILAKLRALWALWIVQLNTTDCIGAQATAERFIQVARQTDERALVSVADRLITFALQQAGNPTEARQRLERAISDYVAPVDQRYVYWLHYDQRVLARAMLARSQWILGFLDQAVVTARRSLIEAEATRDAICVCEVLRLGVCPVTIAIGDADAAKQAVDRLIDTAKSRNARFWVVVGQCLKGQLKIKQREFVSGVDKLREALAMGDQAGWAVWRPEFSGALAVGLAGLNRFEEALEMIEQANDIAARGGENYYVAELLRIKGEVLLKTGDGRISERTLAAEQCFRQAIDLAHGQSALYFELRATRSLAGSRLEQDDVVAATEILSSVYARFIEGFGTVELKETREMIGFFAVWDG